MKRYVGAAGAFEMEYVVRVTGDCPFVDAETLDYCLDACQSLGAFNLASTKSAFPVGIDYEIYSAAVLRDLHESDRLDEQDREHLTKYIYDHSESFVSHTIEPRPEWKTREHTFTINTREDYETALRRVAA